VSTPTYEPRVILQHAERLNRKADSMGITSAAIGAVIGGCLGAVPLTSLGAAWPIPSQFGFGTTLVGLLIGALAGYVIGDARAFGYRLQAQSSLCQLQLEQNTATLLAGSNAEVRYAPAPAVAPRVEFAERIEYSEPYSEPEPAPFVEAPVAEVYEPEPWPEPAPLVEVPRFEPEPAPQTEPEPVYEPAPAALVEVPPPLAPVAPIAAAPEPAPEPAPAPWQSEAAPWPAEQPLPDLATLSLEEIARLAKSGLI